jgi:hypothetical protein
VNRCDARFNGVILAKRRTYGFLGIVLGTGTEGEWFKQGAAALRQVRRLMTLITMQNILAGIKPNWAVLMPMMHMMTLFTVANTQPSQHRRPTRIVEMMVSTQDR